MDYVLRINTGLLMAVFTCVRYVRLCFSFWRRGERVPPVDDDLLRVPAVQLARKIRTGEVSSHHVILAYIRRIRLVNGIINAVAEDRFEDALLDAQRVDEYLKTLTPAEVEALETTKPLLGVPVTIKENLQVKGLSAAMCCVLYKDFKAQADGVAVAKLKDAGAIVLLVSTTPEFCLTIDTYSILHGTTRNPYNSLRSAGGSSGGEGALLGAAASVIGLGSDLAGSIRYPCEFNGVFGHKPSHGFISTEGHNPPLSDPEFKKHTVVGPMCRYAVDLPFLMKILSDHPERLNLDDKVDLSKLKIFFMEDCGMNFCAMKVSDDIKRSIRECAELLGDHCKAQVMDRKFAQLGLAMEICVVVFSQMKLASALDTPQKRYSLLGQLFASLFGRAKFSGYIFNHEIISQISKSTTKQDKVDKYLKILDELRTEMSDALGDNGVLLFPSFPTTAPRHKESNMRYGAVFYTFITNILQFPATSIPLGFDSKGLPIGIQVIANINQDRLCFAVAKEVENILGGWKLT